MTITEGFDEHGRGPLQRAYHERMGYDPKSRPVVGFAKFAAAIEVAMRSEAMDFPTQFQPMMRKAIEDILSIVLPGMIDELVDAKLEPVRKAYKELKAARGMYTPPIRVQGSDAVLSSR